MPDSDKKNLPTLAGELWELVVAYLRQETVEPVKGLVRFVAFGVAGAVLLGLGLVLLALAGLRALQTETGSTLDGSLSWVPYVIVMVFAALVAALAARSIRGRRRRSPGGGSVA